MLEEYINMPVAAPPPPPTQEGGGKPGKVGKQDERRR